MWLDAESQQAARAKATAWFWSHVGSPATRLRQVTEWVLNHTRLVGVVLLGTIALNIWLYISIPKTFFPEQDTGVLMGGIQADQSISFQGDAR
ncbi:multidrug resistance protein [Escherichia coli]|uniref:Multidrug resistance protein n=1 Tax=Escherichia coli TaxID=562 RepID=A0A377B8I3_ECOLX|nr:multidrug resistance protein [Escherichia coli]